MWQFKQWWAISAILRKDLDKFCPLTLSFQSQFKYKWDMSSIQSRCLDIIGIPRTSLSALEGRCNVATKCELKRIVNDIKQNQIFLTKPNTSHSYNLRSKPGSVAIPKSGMQRHTNLFIARAARLLLLWSVYLYLLLLEIHLIVFIVYVFSL